MSSIAQKVASGAAWMVGGRFIYRGIGVISTLILARLLVPEDFGLVAMAMVIFALVDLTSAMGFDSALIKDQKAERRHYDTAWTFRVLQGSFKAVAMVLLAPLAADLFGDERLVHILYALAFVAFVNSWQNIGVVNFRKELTFSKEFKFQVLQKLAAFVATISLAVLYQSYWALIGGIFVGRFTGVALSYAMHPYRPWFSFAGTRDIFGFSAWIFANSVAKYFLARGGHFIIGRIGGADMLGLFTVSREISALPTTQLMMPVMNAVFPGFSKIAHSPERLRQGFLKVQGVLATLTVPAAIGLVVLAEPLVHLALGQNWLEAIPLIQVLGLYGATRVVQGNSSALFMALGKPYWIGILVVLETIIRLPLLAWLLLEYDLETATWAFIIGGLAVVPVGMSVVCWQLSLTRMQLASVVWRPFVAAAVMGAGLYWLGTELPVVDGALTGAIQLLVLAPAGALLYGAVLLGLWWAAGLPKGAESRVMEMVGLEHYLPKPQ